MAIIEMDKLSEGAEWLCYSVQPKVPWLMSMQSEKLKLQVLTFSLLLRLLLFIYIYCILGTMLTKSITFQGSLCCLEKLLHLCKDKVFLSFLSILHFKHFYLKRLLTLLTPFSVRASFFCLVFSLFS